MKGKDDHSELYNEDRDSDVKLDSFGIKRIRVYCWFLVVHWLYTPIPTSQFGPDTYSSSIC